jgi:hypothetical protein
MEKWEFRVLFRSILSRESRLLLGRYRHVAVQINPEDGDIEDVEQARQYLELYFQDAKISLYWGSVEDFVQELARRWHEVSKP